LLKVIRASWDKEAVWVKAEQIYAKLDGMRLEETGKKFLAYIGETLVKCDQ